MRMCVCVCLSWGIRKGTMRGEEASFFMKHVSWKHKWYSCGEEGNQNQQSRTGEGEELEQSLIHMCERNAVIKAIIFHAHDKKICNNIRGRKLLLFCLLSQSVSVIGMYNVDSSIKHQHSISNCLLKSPAETQISPIRITHVLNPKQNESLFPANSSPSHSASSFSK